MIRISIIGCLLLLFSINNEIEAIIKQAESTKIYTVTGKIRKYKNGWIYIKHSDKLNQKIRMDSSKIVDGAFHFSGEISGIQAFLLGIREKDEKGGLLPSIIFKGPFILASGNLYIEGEFNWRNPLSAFGTKEQEEYNLYLKKIEPLDRKITQIIGHIYKIKKSDGKILDSLNKQYSFVQNNIQQAIKTHVFQSPNSFVSAYIAQSQLMNTDPNTINLLYNRLTTEVKESLYGKALLEIVESTKSTEIGRICPLFILSNQNGKEVSLETSKGTYTLINFWASWCGPCRRENPFLNKAYGIFKDKGFQIISISMDTNKSSWLKAIKEDDRSGLQLSDLKGQHSEVGKKYGITTIPMNFLIDKDKKIIARNLSGQQLIDKLQEIL